MDKLKEKNNELSLQQGVSGKAKQHTSPSSIRHQAAHITKQHTSPQQRTSQQQRTNIIPTVVRERGKCGFGEGVPVSWVEQDWEDRPMPLGIPTNLWHQNWGPSTSWSSSSFFFRRSNINKKSSSVTLKRCQRYRKWISLRREQKMVECTHKLKCVASS